jgi:hypothetical protein
VPGSGVDPWRDDFDPAALASRLVRSAERNPVVNVEILADPDLRQLHGASPCDKCRHRRRCAAHDVACASFWSNVEGRTENTWRAASRELKAAGA